MKRRRLSVNQVLAMISVFEELRNMHLEIDAGVSWYLNGLTEVNNGLSFWQLHYVGVSDIMPFHEPPPLLDVPEFVGLGDSYHTLDKLIPHLVSLREILSIRWRRILPLLLYCHDCLMILNNNIRQFFRSFLIDTSDFGTVPPIPPGFGAANDDVLLDINRQTLLERIPHVHQTIINRVHRTLWFGDFLNHYCIPVLSSNYDRGRELHAARASESAGHRDSNIRQGFTRPEINDAESVPPSLNQPPTVSNSNTQEGHGSDDSHN